MRRLLSISVFIVLFGLQSSQLQRQRANFAGFMFGAKEEVDKIQDIEGTNYKLSHKYTLYFFIAGVYLSDDGYILQDKTAFDTYYPHSDEAIRDFQTKGLLPSSLPKYSIPLIEYLFGYSLWIVIALSAAWPSLKHLLRRLTGKRFCPHCKLEMTPYESETKICGACGKHL